MKKAIIILVIAIFLLSLGIFEVISVGNILDSIKISVDEIAPKYEDSKDDITYLADDVKKIGDYWKSKEYALCLIFNNKDLSLTTDSINRLFAFTKNNDYNNAYAEIQQLKSIVDKNSDIMGFNFQNVM